MPADEVARELARVTEERMRLEKEVEAARARLEEVREKGESSGEHCTAEPEAEQGGGGGGGGDVPANKTWSQVVSRRNPRLYVLEDFFSAEECDHVMRVAEPLLEASTITDKHFEKKRGSKHKIRNSWTGHDKGRRLETSDPIVRKLLERIHEHVFIPMAYGEPVQVAKYGPGEYYEFHKDSDTKVGRYATVIVYLQDVEAGGETVFPAVNRRDHAKLGLPNIQWGQQEQPPMKPFCEHADVTKVAPKRGRAVLFFNHYPDLQEDHYALHGSCPVQSGLKWIFQRWIRFYKDSTGNVFYNTFFRGKGR
eukprot:TRINITY_DN2320_c0_g1_i1.p1 TRINITY_DN2320_c0_g1~~TRINITY_DN2320_c0_g1_i1.p1  ORF type:complete len:349 (+),score=127.69 TRINITY_DN2320_c0_g1_i1:125-1048(+)